MKGRYQPQRAEAMRDPGKTWDAHASVTLSDLPLPQNREGAFVTNSSYLRFVVLPWREGLAGPFDNTVNMKQLCCIIKDFTKELHSADLPFQDFSLFFKKRNFKEFKW